MTDTTTMNPTDYLKYVAAETSALIESAQSPISALDHNLDDDRVEAIVAQLIDARSCAIEAAAAFCRSGHDIEHYADGRQVRTRLEIEKGNEFEYVWHPQVDHHTNRTQELFLWTTTSGARKRILITAPGHLDAIDVLRAAE
jgi:hypothetical protein